jgi:hypothetical protein
MHSTSTASLAVRALSRPWPRGRFRDASVHLAGWRTAAPVHVRPGRRAVRKPIAGSTGSGEATKQRSVLGWSDPPQRDFRRLGRITVR